MFRGLSSDLGLKITAVILAVIIWYYVFQMQGPEVAKTFNVALTTRNVPSDLAVSCDVTRATIVLRGSKVLIDDLPQENIIAYIDLLNHKAGSDQVNVQVDFPQSVKLNSVTPEVVLVELQHIETVELPIAIEYNNQPSPGITLSQPTFDPQKMTVTGPQKIVSMLSSVKVKLDRSKVVPGQNIIKLPFSFVTNESKTMTDAELKKANLRAMYPTITVEINGTSRESTKVVGIRAKTTGAPPSNYIINSIDWQPKMVTITGSYNIISKIDYVYTKPLNLNGIVSSGEQEMQLDLPDGVTSTDTQTVKVKYTIEPFSMKVISVYVDIINNGNYNYTIKSRRISIQIQGPRSLVDGVVTASANADISNLEPGLHVVPIEMSGLPDGVTVASTPNIEITIKP